MNAEKRAAKAARRKWAAEKGKALIKHMQSRKLHPAELKACVREDATKEAVTEKISLAVRSREVWLRLTEGGRHDETERGNQSERLIGEVSPLDKEQRYPEDRLCRS